MEDATVKSNVLKDAGYSYNFDRMVYVNRAQRKAFSVEFLQDHSVDEIRIHIAEKTNGPQWHFYFNSEPPPAVARELEGALG